MPKKSKKPTKAQEDFYASLVDSHPHITESDAPKPKASASSKPHPEQVPREDPLSKPLSTLLEASVAKKHDLPAAPKFEAPAPSHVAPTISTPVKFEPKDIEDTEPDVLALNIPFGFDLSQIQERSDCNFSRYIKLLQEICPAGVHEELGAKILDLRTSKSYNYNFLFAALIDNKVKPEVAEYFLNNIGVFQPYDDDAT